MEGVYSVAQTAQMIRQYRYAEEQMMRIMAGWIALTPELVVKLEFTVLSTLISWASACLNCVPAPRCQSRPMPHS
jgi:hypothetical protein